MTRLTVALMLGVLAQQALADAPEPIVGGSLALPGEFPYQCNMIIDGDHFCGCSILSPTKILTAGHCVEDLELPNPTFFILTGSINRLGGKKHAVKSAVMHPEYETSLENSWVNDIAIVTVKDPIEFDKYTSPVTLPTNPPKPGFKCVLSGWGMIFAKGPIPRYLKKMKTSLIANDDCTEEQGGLKIYNSQVCAFTRFGVGACQGDSGGPLVCSDGCQYGITSFAAPCALGVPDVYTNVHYHLKFINEQMKKP